MVESNELEINCQIIIKYKVHSEHEDENHDLFFGEGYLKDMAMLKGICVRQSNVYGKVVLRESNILFKIQWTQTWLFQTDSILLDIMVFGVTGLVCLFVCLVGLV